MKLRHVVLASFLGVLLVPATATARQGAPQRSSPGDLDPRAPLFELPDLQALLAAGGMRDLITRQRTDARTLDRFYDVALSPTRAARRRALTQAWLEGILALEFDALGIDDRIDHVLFQNLLRRELRRLELDQQRRAETAPLLPFARQVVELQEQRRRLQPIEPERAADELVALAEQVDALRGRVHRDDTEHDRVDAIGVDRLIANRAAGEVRQLRSALSAWFRYRDGYDPLFSWWVREPWERLDGALEAYATHLREEVAGVDEDDDDTILGDPIGAEALRAELAHEFLAYTPEELLEIAETELAWCDREFARAADELGFGDDWRAAQEHVKSLHVAPGEQPELIRRLAFEAVDFLEEHDLVTIPALAKNSWRMEMMSPERQKYTPYFTGGEVVSVSYPTADMEHEAKRMSMRGNNVHFSRAVVHHELIPGHHLQQYMTARHKTWRRPFSTPFWGEGWALYWEMLLWDAGFPRAPEDRVGMLFWRKHRCARILFSLRFQLGEWTPDECIDFLVERVGHERNNAAAEVRRSVQGGYGPLYQAAYMLGGLQLRALHRELVGAGEWSDRAFHDAILREGSIPIELVRARLTGVAPQRDFHARWRFHEELR